MQLRRPGVPNLRPAVLASLATVTLLLAGCGSGADAPGTVAGGSGSPRSSPPPLPSETSGSATATTGADGGLVVTTRHSDYGTVLFNGAEQAIYLFDKESTERAECYGACAEAWPPVLTQGGPQVAGAARAGLLGTTERRDGTTQVTYDGHPLYYYVTDGPGQILCHNVTEFGGLWLVVTPSGAPAA